MPRRFWPGRLAREDDPTASTTARPRGGRRTADRAPVAPRTTTPGWEQKTVAVLAIEVTWPDGDGQALPASDPWTEAAAWERSVTERVAGLARPLSTRGARGLHCYPF